MHNVTHIVTGGRLDSRSDQRVTAYAVSFTVSGWKWDWYRGLMQVQLSPSPNIFKIWTGLAYEELVSCRSAATPRWQMP